MENVRGEIITIIKQWHVALKNTEKRSKMDEKIATIKRRMSGVINDITTHTVSAEWYRRYVDMDYTGEDAVEIVQIEYEYDLCAIPRYMMAVEFKHTPIGTLCDKLEI